MDRWEKEADFIEWLLERQETAKRRVKGYQVKGELDFTKGDCSSRQPMAYRNARVDVKKMEKILDNELLEHMNLYFYQTEIDIFHIANFFNAVERVSFFKVSYMSSDASKYKEQIKKLKEKADELQHFSPTQIKIRLPELPQVILFSLIKQFKRYGLKEEDIRYFYEFFNRKKLPREGTTYTNRLKLWDKIVNEERQKKDHFYTLGMHIAAEAIHWYSPKMKNDDML